MTGLETVKKKFSAKLKELESSKKKIVELTCTEHVMAVTNRAAVLGHSSTAISEREIRHFLIQAGASLADRITHHNEASGIEGSWGIRLVENWLIQNDFRVERELRGDCVYLRISGWAE